MEIPLTIKAWLNSEPMTTIYEELADKFSIDVAILTLALYYLESKQISPADFAAELQKRAGKELSPELVRQIIEKVLTPIKDDLFKFGINISLIQAIPQMPVSTTAAPIVPSPVMPAEPITQTAAVAPAIPSPASQPTPAAPTPYILHQEAAFKTLSEEHNINYEPIRQAFFSSSQTPAPIFKQPIMPAKIQFGGHKEETTVAKKPSPAKTEIFVPKIVHYSALKTPVSPFNSQVPTSEESNVPEAPPVAAKANIIPPAKFNDRIIENASKEALASAAENKRIDLKDLPL